MKVVIDNQRQPKPAAFVLDLRMPFDVIAHEIPMALWEEYAEWIDTVKGDL
jgi:hypothetical protein